jgi:hypothetical protein
LGQQCFEQASKQVGVEINGRVCTDCPNHSTAAAVAERDKTRIKATSVERESNQASPKYPASKRASQSTAKLPSMQPIVLSPGHPPRPSIVIMEVIHIRYNTKYVTVVIHIRYNTKYVTVMAASYAAIVGRNSNEVVLCRVIIAENIRKEEKTLNIIWLLLR